AVERVQQEHGEAVGIVRSETSHVSCTVVRWLPGNEARVLADFEVEGLRVASWSAFWQLEQQLRTMGEEREVELGGGRPSRAFAAALGPAEWQFDLRRPWRRAPYRIAVGPWRCRQGYSTGAATAGLVTLGGRKPP
ncbi:hypothetical protein HKBW3S33_02424, partial [Candidatus Hakubella thermalkaliphila]